MQPIRVLHIVSIMNRGGLETFIMNVYRNIDREKVQFDFLVNREEVGAYDKEIIELGGRIYNIPHMNRIGYKKHKNEVRKFLKNNKQYKIIHSHVNTLSGIYLREAKKENIPIRIAHSHNTKLPDKLDLKGMLNMIFRMYSKSMIRRSANKYFACSTQAAYWLYGRKITESFSEIINNGIKTSEFIFDEKIRYEKRRELNIDEDTIILGNVASFTNQKNHIKLLEIFNEILKQNENVKLCLVGDGELKHNIMREIKCRNIEDKVILLGIREDVNKLLMAFDIFLLPSLYEGLPLVLIEAQSTGIQCIVSNSITKEVDLGLGLMHFVDIKNSDLCIDKIISIIDELKLNKIKRNSNIIKIKSSGYDIHTTSDYLQDIYLQGEKK